MPARITNADASIGLLDIRLARFRRGLAGVGAAAADAPDAAGVGPARDPIPAAWQLLVRHHAGSLDAAVAQARWRNLAVTAGVLLLLVVTLGALVRFTRNAQRLAQLQMDFVAGVSHELRTPLTAIYTAGHNLRGKVAQKPAQVERYGEMIQQESGPAEGSGGTGAAVRERGRGPRDSGAGAGFGGSVIERERGIEPGGAAGGALHRRDRHRAGTAGDHGAIRGAQARAAEPAGQRGEVRRRGRQLDRHRRGGTGDRRRSGVEIRVTDHGPGIPAEEQAHIFDPFFRGRRACRTRFTARAGAEPGEEDRGGARRHDPREERAGCRARNSSCAFPRAPAGAADELAHPVG